MYEQPTAPALFPRNFYMTWLLLAANVLVYFWVSTQGGFGIPNLIAMGAKENGLIALGEWHRLIFPMFLHGGFVHIIMNMYTLFYIGKDCEFLLGSKNLFLIYVGSGISGIALSTAFTNQVSVGASSSIYGIFLCIYVLYRAHLKKMESEGLPQPQSSFGMLLLVNIVFSFAIPNVDWAAHLGGGLAGALFGWGFLARHRYYWRLSRSARFRFLDGGHVAPRLTETRWYPILSWAAMTGLFLTPVLLTSTNKDKVYGMGLKATSELDITTRSAGALFHNPQDFLPPNPIWDMDGLLAEAMAVHSQGRHPAASSTWEALLFFHSGHVGPETFQSALTKEHIQLAWEASLQKEPLPAEALSLAPHFDPDAKGNICLKEAQRLAVLGHSGLAARLYECAWALDPQKLEWGAQAFAEWVHAGDDPTESTMAGSQGFGRFYTHLRGNPPERWSPFRRLLTRALGEVQTPKWWPEQLAGDEQDEGM